jgi:hypothetical protein
MSWREIQLGSNMLCDQDRLILDLFSNQTVRYVGKDLEAGRHLDIDPASSNLVLILNSAMWCSDIVKICRSCLKHPITKFYIGINRYFVLGNDIDVDLENTAQKGQDIINFLSTVVDRCDYTVKKSGHYDHDRGRHFNFIQPLTWIYGTTKTNSSD